MGLLNNLFLEKEIKAIIGVLLELEFEFKVNPHYEEVRSLTENLILKNKDEILSFMRQKRTSPRLVAILHVNFIADNLVSNGKNHSFRGTLNTSGAAYLNIFDKSTDLLLQVGHLSTEEAVNHKKNIRDRIQQVG